MTLLQAICEQICLHIVSNRRNKEDISGKINYLTICVPFTFEVFDQKDINLKKYSIILKGILHTF